MITFVGGHPMPMVNTYLGILLNNYVHNVSPNKDILCTLYFSDYCWVYDVYSGSSLKNQV